MFFLCPECGKNSMKFVAVSSTIKCLYCGMEESCRDYDELEQLLSKDKRFVSMPDWQIGSAVDSFGHPRFVITDVG